MSHFAALRARLHGKNSLPRFRGLRTTAGDDGCEAEGAGSRVPEVRRGRACGQRRGVGTGAAVSAQLKWLKRAATTSRSIERLMARTDARLSREQL